LDEVIVNPKNRIPRTNQLNYVPVSIEDIVGLWKSPMEWVVGEKLESRGSGTDPLFRAA
jgi:hypothetical protein